MPHRYLRIYLNDHLAAAVLGVELAKRVAGNNKGTEFYDDLEDLREEIQEDRERLMKLMNELNIPQNPVKAPTSWVAEKVGRLKFNGRLTGYSPLSRLLELEALTVGIEGKASLWTSLKELVDEVDGLNESWLDSQLRRAEGQKKKLDDLHRRAAAVMALAR